MKNPGRVAATVAQAGIQWHGDYAPPHAGTIGNSSREARPAALEETAPHEDAHPPLEESSPPGQPGPGLRPNKGVDPTLVTAAVFIVVGYTPVAWWEAALRTGHFGPLQIPAIVAMVGILFAFIALLRSIDLQDRRLRMWAGIALALGLVRLFLFPFA